MKEIAVILLAVTVLSFGGANYVRAEKPLDASTAAKAKHVAPGLKERALAKVESVKEKIAARQEERQDKKETIVERVRQSVKARWEAYKKAIARTDALLDKLQIRIDRAKEAGEDIAEMETLMADARENLAAASEKLAEIESQKGEDVNKASFLEIHNLFRAITKDLHAVRVDAAKIISLLKSFNSATSNGKNPQATASAVRKINDKKPQTATASSER